MTNSVKLFGLASLAALALTVPASAQTNTLYSTTITSTAMTNTQKYVCLSSASNIDLPSVSKAGSRLVIDHEAMDIQAVTDYSSTCFKVSRPHAAAHAASSAVLFGPPNWFASVAPQGGAGSACTKSSLYAYPVVAPSAGDKALTDVWYCVASKWAAGAQQVPSGYTQFSTISVPNAIAVNATTGAAGTLWYSQLFVPSSATLTGACLLNGATVGTDKVIYALYDAAGTLLANTAVAGTITATASKYQCIAFTATVPVVGPGLYFIAAQTNGTTDNFATYAANSVPTAYGASNATGTFGTLPAITPPTTFTANKGPIMMVY